MLSKMELEGMKNGTFPMDKEEGIEACRKYREALEAKGVKTYLEYRQCGLFHVMEVRA